MRGQLRNRIDYGLAAAREARRQGDDAPRLLRWLVTLTLVVLLLAVFVSCAHAVRPAANGARNYWLPTDDAALVCTPYLERGLCVTAGEIRTLIGTRKVAP